MYMGTICPRKHSQSHLKAEQKAKQQGILRATQEVSSVPLLMMYAGVAAYYLSDSKSGGGGKRALVHWFTLSMKEKGWQVSP